MKRVITILIFLAALSGCAANPNLKNTADFRSYIDDKEVYRSANNLHAIELDDDEIYYHFNLRF